MTDSRFDFALIPSGPVNETAAFAELGEELGYRCMWIPDQGFHRDPFCIAALAAQRTNSIDIGIGITSPWTRLPVQIARVAATLDEVSAGRLRLGLGMGNKRHVLAPLGLPSAHAPQRMEDAVAILRALLRGERVTFAGRDDTLIEVALDFPTRPDVPLYIGTRGPRMLELCGRVADGVLVESLFNADGLGYVFDHIGRNGAGAGASDRLDVVAWQLVHVTDDARPVIDTHKPWIARSIQAGPPLAMERIGIDPEVIARVSAAMNRGDADTAIAAVTDDTVRSLMLVGPPGDLIERVQGVFDRGATTISALGIGRYDDVASSLRRFARDVMTAFA